MKRDSVYLYDIQECIERIREYTASGKEAFLTQTMIQDAVVRNFEIMGEAAKKLSDAAKAQEPDIPWQKVCRFRDFLIHNYRLVRTEFVWEIIEVDLEPLRQAVKRLMQSSR